MPLSEGMGPICAAKNRLTFSVNHQIIILLLLRKKPLSEGVGPIYAALKRLMFAVKIVILKVGPTYGAKNRIRLVFAVKIVI